MHGCTNYKKVGFNLSLQHQILEEYFVEKQLSLWQHNESMRTLYDTYSKNVNTVAINMGNSPNSSANSSSEEIKKLYELKEKGIITQEEFDLKKKTIL
ncbi:putative oligomerization/nucleic acid binding protein [Bacteroides zoogleoformans]|nr:putative oligomerization/nucleic acid binding protein [Bacteroides zoogleoformans]